MSKKISTLAKDGIAPLLSGVANTVIKNKDAEELATKRAEICKACPQLVDEPVSFLAVSDETNPDVSGKMCNACGCAVPLKIRQNKKICKYWANS